MTATRRTGRDPGRGWLAGAVVGMAIGAAGRAALLAYHLHEASQPVLLAGLVVAGIGLVIGGLSGMTRNPWVGGLAGAVLSAAVYVVTLPVGLLMEAMQLGRASLIEVVAVGALAGAAGGAAGRSWGGARRAAR